MTTANDLLSASDELDLSSDSAVEVKEAIWSITEVEVEQTESDNGSGTRVNIVFASEDFPYDITMRLFVAYTPTDESKSTDWVKRQRGQLKNIAKAAIGVTQFSLNESA